MKESGTTGAGEPQISGVSSSSCSWTPQAGTPYPWTPGNIVPLGQTSGVPLTPRTRIHGSMVTDGANL